MSKGKCDCRSCCFDLIPKETGSRNCWDILCDGIVTGGQEVAAVTYCAMDDQLWTYYRSEEWPDFKCDLFVPRGALEKGYSKGKICQYKEVYENALYNDYGNHRKELALMWERFHAVIKYGLSKLPKKERDKILGCRSFAVGLF